MFCSAQMIYAVINARFMVFQKNSYKQKGCYIVLYTYIKKLKKIQVTYQVWEIELLNNQYTHPKLATISF